MKRLLVALALLSIFFNHSCSKTIIGDNSVDNELESFTAWMKAYEPDAIPFDDSLEGYYRLSPAGLSTEKIKEGDWVKIIYTGQSLNGSYFKNFYQSLSYLLGTFKSSTHFIPMYAQIDSTHTTYITEGMYKALHMMSPGDSVSLFLSSKLAYGASGTTISTDGFQGDKTSVSPYAPVHICMRLEEIVEDPVGYEQKQVEEYAKRVLKMATYDSIGNGLYLKVTEPNPQGDTIGSDSLVYIRYTGYFLDGFVFDTNVESVADQHNINYNKDLLTYQEAGSSSEASSTIESWNVSILKMRKGESAIILSTSHWAYESAGKMGDTTTIIYPYTPLVFDIRILTDEEYDEQN